MKRKTRGGMGMVSQPHPMSVFTTIVAYGISSLIIGPIYLLASLLNMPISNLNNLSGKAFEENKQMFLHIPFYKMIKGCPIKDLDPTKFLLQDDMHIHKNAAVVSCEKETLYSEKDKVTEQSASFSDSVLDVLGMIPEKRKLRHYVFGLFEYIDNLRETDEERKKHVQKLLHYVPYKTLIQCYLIYKTIKCGNLSNEKTVLADEDVIHMVNPLYYPSTIRDNYTRQVKCMWMHMTQKHFNEKDKIYCDAPCKSCTFNNSVRRTFKKYGSMFSGGKTSSLISMFNTYYDYLTIERRKDAVFPEKADQVVPFLNKHNVSSDLEDKLEESDRKEVLVRFNRFLCKYDIIPTVEKQIEIKIQEKLSRGYSMQQILDFL
jgi:hypothetical protein